MGVGTSRSSGGREALQDEFGNRPFDILGSQAALHRRLADPREAAHVGNGNSTVRPMDHYLARGAFPDNRTSMNERFLLSGEECTFLADSRALDGPAPSGRENMYCLSHRFCSNYTPKGRQGPMESASRAAQHLLQRLRDFENGAVLLALGGGAES